VRALLAGDRRVTARRIWESGVAGNWPSTGGALSTLLRRPELLASNGGVLAT